MSEGEKYKVAKTCETCTYLEGIPQDDFWNDLFRPKYWCPLQNLKFEDVNILPEWMYCDDYERLTQYHVFGEMTPESLTKYLDEKIKK